MAQIEPASGAVALPLPPSGMRDAIAAADAGLGRIARVVATAGALAMLGVALFTTFDVIVLRWVFNAPIAGTNEIFQTIFPTAIAAVLAAGLCARATLEIDLLGLALTPRQIQWLRALGAVLFLVTIILITWAVYKQSMSAYNRGTITSILQWRLWPWYFTITALFALCVPAQLIVALRASAELTERWYVGVAICFGTVLALAWAAVALFMNLQMFFLSNMLTAAVLLVALLWLLMLLYVPLAAALTACACLGVLGLFGSSQAINIAGAETKGLLTSLDLAVIPFFLMMGGFAVHSGMSRDMFNFAQAVFKPFRGGLALATIGGSAGFGALAGSSTATVATVGSIAYPEMRQRNYATWLSAGSITAGGTLGPLIPPSTAAVVYALLVEQSIGTIYIAMMIPALITVLFYMATIVILLMINPSATPKGEPVDWAEIRQTGARSFSSILLFSLVFGGILAGVFTANEAAGVGAVVAFAVLVLRGGLRGGGFWKVMAETTRSTSMIYFLIIGALITTFFFSATGLTQALAGFVVGLDMQAWQIIVVMCIGYILLGLVLDSMAIMMITAAISSAIVTSLGYDPIWWAVVMVVVVEIGVLTPPFGLNLFMLKSVVPSLPLRDLYIGVLPFVLADLIKLGLLIAFPVIVLWLPGFL